MTKHPRAPKVLKLSIFQNKWISEDTKQTNGFLAAVTYLPLLYAASMSEVQLTNLMTAMAVGGETDWLAARKELHDAFSISTRAEAYLSPCEADPISPVHVAITFYLGSRILDYQVNATFDETGMIREGTLGSIHF